MGNRWLKTFGTFLVMGIIIAIAAAIVSFISAAFGVQTRWLAGFFRHSINPSFRFCLLSTITLTGPDLHQSLKTKFHLRRLLERQPDRGSVLTVVPNLRPILLSVRVAGQE